MASEFGYRMTYKAESDLDSIVSYIAVELSNPSAASDFVDKLLSQIHEAQQYPESGALVVNEFLPDSSVRKKIVGNYIMYYLPSFEERIIYVLRIVYGRRNMDTVLTDL